jgi:hypothetical protein
VAQFNYWNGPTRQAITQVLLYIAGVADMVRVDMAMLALNVIAKTWGAW